MRKLFLLLAFAAVLAGCRRETPAESKKTAATATAPTGVDVGQMMPEYSATWLDGSKFNLASKRNKVVLLNVWATWCGPCRVEIPELQKLHNELAPKGFEVIGVSVDEGDPGPVREFVQEQKVTYPIALDPEGRLGGVLQTGILPTSVLLDRTGKIVWKQYGMILPGDEELMKAIEKAL